ncbi:hypothetical protein ACRALDRAFT_1065291, partial [Sodiomyces alcalophilus JCM 7366]|uniref:uncharacterized protein n=1 Tax=Sodiomyces alcalophilus JCM 7366 TaxID=591952 RepID=UPI0039B69596
MVWCTSGAETIPLSRDGSGFENASLPEAAPMARPDSIESDLTGSDTFSAGGFAGCGANHSVLDPAQLYHGYASSAPTGHFAFGSTGVAGMERSHSTNSAVSTQSSAESRAREARKRQIKNAQRARLLPKPQAAAAVVAPEASATTKDGKVAVAKHSGYARSKKTAKVFCDLCNDHADGFRGEHELKRHMQAKHQGVVKKYVCRDPATAGIASTVQVVVPLESCKHCVNRKEYGAYYNAAAHLRRTHFKPKQSRGKAEKRGGKGGGDWPHMNELRKWFEEVHVELRNDPGAGRQPCSDAEVDDEVEAGDMSETVRVNGQMYATTDIPVTGTAETLWYSTDGDSGYSYSLPSDAMTPNLPMMDMATDVMLPVDSSGEATSWAFQEQMSGALDGFTILPLAA